MDGNYEVVAVAATGQVGTIAAGQIHTSHRQPARGAVVAHSANVWRARRARRLKPRPARVRRLKRPPARLRRSLGACGPRASFPRAREKPAAEGDSSSVSELASPAASKTRPRTGLLRWRQVGGRCGAHTAMPCSSDQPSGRPGRVHLDRVGTEPMTSQQREQAAAALAALITAWQRQLAPNLEGPGSDYARLLPLPGVASDTDHAA